MNSQLSTPLEMAITRLKIPGGGVEVNEGRFVAAKMDAIEETVCAVEVLSQHMVITEEWRNDLHQISHRHRACLVDVTGVPDLTEDELADGFEHQWASVPAVIEKMRIASLRQEGNLGK